MIEFAIVVVANCKNMCTKVDDHIGLNHDLHNKVVIEISSIIKSTINDIE